MKTNTKLRQPTDPAVEAIEEILSTIEDYLSVAPFGLIYGEGGDPNDSIFKEHETKFDRFCEPFEHWIEALDPRAVEASEVIEDSNKELERCLGTNNTGKQALSNLYSSFNELCFATQELAFSIGLLVGAKSMGASREDLRLKSVAILRLTESFRKRQA